MVELIITNFRQDCFKKTISELEGKSVWLLPPTPDASTCTGI